jgi:hypothetical protein
MKRRLYYSTCITLGIVVTLLSACVLAARGAEPPQADKIPAAGKPAKSVTAELERTKDQLAPTYRLAYQMKPGELVRTKVVHLATVETKIKGVAQTTKSRTVSTRLWKIRAADAQGNITFDHSVERVEMWNSIEGRQEVHYDSAVDKSPPAEFATVAAAVGKVLATIKIDPHGRILERNNALAQFNPGIGEVTVPFPNVPIKSGNSWSIPDELKLPLEDGTIKKVATRQQYRLEKVEAGVATIVVETQVLTPVNDPKVQSQLVQRLQRGTIQFDVDAGRLIRKQMDIDEEVFGFSGNDSHMQYLARFTEEPIPASEQTATAPTADAAQR